MILCRYPVSVKWSAISDMRGTSIKLDLHSTSSEYVLEEKYDESVCVPLFFFI